MRNNAAAEEYCLPVEDEMLDGFDQLPAELRAAINYADGKYSGHEALTMLQIGFPPEAVRAIITLKDYERRGTTL